MDPAMSFEDEILSINPDYDLIFSQQEEKSLNQSPQPLEEDYVQQKYSPRKMKIISKMNEIIGVRPVGDLPSHKDWDNTESIEKETIALMRTLGLEPSIDRPPDEKRTISTVPTNDDVILMRNGRRKMQIFMADTYFELKPRSEPSFCTEEDDTSTETSTMTDFSDDVNIYEPIPLDSTNETQVTTISEDDSLDSSYGQYAKKEQKRTEPVRHFDYGVSEDSCKRQWAEDYPELSWRRKSPLPEVSRERRNGRKSYNRRSTDSGSSSSSWWHSNDSSTDARDENNWRVSKQPQVNAISEEKTKKNEKIIEAKPEPKATSNCGSPLFTPKELFLKRKALMIQKVLSANQS